LLRKRKERGKRGEERKKGRERGCAPQGALLTWHGASVASGGKGKTECERSEPCLLRKRKERGKRGEKRKKGRERGCAPQGALLTWHGASVARDASPAR